MYCGFAGILRRACLVFSTTFAMVTAANAHIKWFCAYDVAGQPRGLENVLCPDFESLLLLAIGGLLLGNALEVTPVGPALLRAMDRVTAWPRAEIETIFRWMCAAFFLALWAEGGMFLTPELKTTSIFIPWLQLAIGAGMLWRPAFLFSAAGIYFLFLQSLLTYGLFHLLDYPIFIGIAEYFLLSRTQSTLFGLGPRDILKWSTGITLMWASIEKWAYPQWTFPLFLVHPHMTLGFDPEFYMRAAGMIEFVLAFALLWTPLVRRASAVVLLGMFLAAIPVFGKIDAIGHAPIIAILLVMICDNQQAIVGFKQVVKAPLALLGSLAVVLFSYYELHAVIYHTSLT